MTDLNQQGDMRFYCTTDGGELYFEGGLVESTVIESAVYLCLMGGNMEDEMTIDTKKYQWMGNEDEEPQNQFRSRFQALIYGRPITSELINTLGEAAALDILDGFNGYADKVECQVKANSKNNFTVTSKITAIDGKFFDVQTIVSKNP